MLDHERRPFAAVDVDFGIAWRRDGAGDSIDLMATYAAANGRRIDAVLRAAFPYVE